MADEHPSPIPRRSALGRYGPLAVILVAISLVAVLASVGNDSSPSGQVATAGTTTPKDPTANPDLPISYADAKKAGTLDQYDFGQDCDPATGRLRIPSLYSPPCLAAPKGVKGGATYPGVTADTIKVVNYVPAQNGGISTALAAQQDPQPVQRATRQKMVEMLNDIGETWGRKVEVVDYQSKAQDNDEQGARADAIAVAAMKPFASLGGPNLTPIYADELAKRKILCIGCGIAVPDSRYQQNAPYMWGPLQTPEQFLVNVGDFIVKRLLNRNASFAGDPAMRKEKRVFGVVKFDQDPPVFGDVSSEVLKRGAKRGYKPTVTETYILDLPKLPERAATIIAKMKAAGVTTIVFLGDPIMPINLTKEAESQDYHPEWVVTGTVLTDTTTLGRLYDQDQWAHAFGLSSLAGRTKLEDQDARRIYRWYYGEEPESKKNAALIYQPLQLLYLGIHMAGPNLNPQTFQGGMFSYPPTGGGPTTPRISFGNHGLFENPDYIAIDDSAEIWWDATAKGPDEQGKDGTGMWRYPNDGKRYLPGTMPATPPEAGVTKDAPGLFDPVPPQDRPPTYPSPKRGN